MVTTTTPIPAAAPSVTAPRLRVPAPIDRAAFADLRRELAIRFCKWDPQVGDTSTIAPFPLVISRECWRELAELSTQLARELLEAESQLLHRPDLYKQLGVRFRIRRCLGSASPPMAAPRIMRFDFHPTPDGWRISEVNSDVPGGFTESSSLPQLMARHYPDHVPVDDPAGKWTAALITAAQNRPIGLITAPGFMEDHQITDYLALRISEQGGRALTLTARQLTWRDQRAFANDTELGLVLRFFQAEWLPTLGGRSGWQIFFASKTPISNPAHSILSESKRFPLVWDDLKLDLPTWRRLLPPTCDPRCLSSSALQACILKTAYSNNGDSVASPASPTWRKAFREAWWFPGQWIAQKRFDILPLATPLGLMHPCLGVYVIDGAPAGIYGRISANPIIDFGAIDVAILLEKES